MAASVVGVVAVGSGASEVSLLQRASEGGAISDAAAQANDARQLAILVVQLLVTVVGAVFFIRWFSAAYKNLPSLGAENLRYGPGWAVGSWFVPILNFFRPKEIANDIWRASDPDRPISDRTGWRQAPLTPVLAGWWAAGSRADSSVGQRTRCQGAPPQPSLTSMR